ncbi:MAG: hypothetical protein IPN86_21890 [Saprospiraceae bacterium]|nr:hypothetical protein [Saprospiraceae bacterium]
MQTKGYTREEQFYSSEKPLLKPLPDMPFEIQYTRIYKVAQNNHICLSTDKHYYSVPFTYIGQKVKVIYTRSTVRIYHKGGIDMCTLTSCGSRKIYNCRRASLLCSPSL